KAFGANANTILLQFIFENIILTLIGGFIGWILAILVIFIINDSGLLEDIELRFHYLTFIYSLLICIVFGVLSGAIPAYRISKLNIVESLKRAV
ncbi:MAG: FtsX-like permease family protein, partial [Bacteroidota bacterium]